MLLTESEKQQKDKLHTGALEHFRIIKVREGDYLFIEREGNFMMTKHHSSLVFIYLIRGTKLVFPCVFFLHI